MSRTSGKREATDHRSRGFTLFMRLRTTKDVKKGSELITDYGSAYWEDHSRFARLSSRILQLP